MDEQARVALVTGATSGLGAAAARKLSERGLRVIASGRDSKRGAAVVEEIRSAGGDARFVAADIGVPTDVEALVEEACASSGRLDVAVNCAASTAGVGIPLGDVPDAAFDEQLAVSLKGTWLCMREELRAMSDGGGSIVNVASINGLSGARGVGAYAAAKHGVVGLTRTAAQEYASARVRINAVCPGPFDTPMLRSALSAVTGGDPEPAASAYQAQIPAGRFGDPDEAGELIAWIAADAPAFLTGASIVVDGGLTA